MSSTGLDSGGAEDHGAAAAFNEPGLAISALSIGPLEGSPSQPQVAQNAPVVVKNETCVIAFNITERFTAAAKTLKPGQLVKDGYFTLFESVGALEIMDPKMDSGCLAEGESLDSDYDVGRRLLPSEVVGIIDQLLCHEMAWHLGYPLSQTLLTNIYIENMLSPEPTTIEEADFLRPPPGQAPSSRDLMHTVLRAYCLGLVKSCYYVNERIKYEHYYEEEDFVTNTYHRTLLEKIDKGDIQDAIQEARALLHGVHQAEMAPEMVRALDFRLELRFAFLRAIELTDLRSRPLSMKTPWVEMKAVLEQIRVSHPLGTPVPDACSPKLQRRLASTMPPRPIVHLSFEDAHGHLKRLCADGAEVSDVLKYTDSQTLLNFVIHFQAQKPQPLVYVRTLLQSYVFRDNIILGSMSIRQVIDDDLSLVVLPCSPLLDPTNDLVENPSHPKYAVAHQMEQFRQRAAQPYLEIFRALCQNRCRIRRNFCHAIQDWEMVQVDAEEIDQLLQIQLNEQPVPSSTEEPVYSLPLSSWAYLYKLRLMEWIVQLGFELEVYQPDELAGMYWYLSYLASKRRQHLDRIKAFTLETMNRTRHRHSQTHPGAPMPPDQEDRFTRSLSFLRTAIIEAAVTVELATALANLYALITRLRLMPPPARPYSTDELRFEVRMKPFAQIGLPEMPLADSYAYEASQDYVRTPAVLDNADQAVADARKTYEALAKFPEDEAFAAGATHVRWVADVKNCVKASISTAIAISTVRKAYESATAAAIVGVPPGCTKRPMEIHAKAEVPRPDQGYHPWWIVPKIIDTTPT